MAKFQKLSEQEIDEALTPLLIQEGCPIAPSKVLATLLPALIALISSSEKVYSLPKVLTLGVNNVSRKEGLPYYAIQAATSQVLTAKLNTLLTEGSDLETILAAFDLKLDKKSEILEVSSVEEGTML